MPNPLVLRPDLPPGLLALYLDVVTELVDLGELPDAASVSEVVVEALAGVGRAPDRSAFEAAVRVAGDLLLQGWELVVVDASRVEAHAPDVEDGGRRATVRRLEQLKRDEDLRKDSVRAFVKGMERRRFHKAAFTSVVSLMTDGADLADVLARGPAVVPIRPYVQAVEPGRECELTGLDLWDIWRYFRLTWSNQHTSVPGRSMSFLVRDSSRDHHPVVGIFALSSPVVQIRLRDEALGWHPDTVLDELVTSGDPNLLAALERAVERGLRGTWVTDLLAEGLLQVEDLRAPQPGVTARLVQFAAEERKKHERSPDREVLKSTPTTPAGWRRRAETTLYRSKRALQLVDLLTARSTLSGLAARTPEAVRTLAGTSQGKRVIRRLARWVKAEKVGISLADLSVCGALAPYTHILGGKLVAMLAASPDAVTAYRDRYREARSDIASSMAGEPVVRPPELAFIGTTSLYGVTPNQYTRAGYPAEVIGGQGTVRYRKLGRTEAYGSSQFSAATVQALAATASARDEFTRVNHFFGEGASPKMRKLRGGLDQLDLPSDRLLRHDRARVVYGVELVSNAREYLLGLAPKPEYLFPLDRPDAVQDIAQYWWTRWALPRLDGRIERVEVERLVRPLRHGAAVQLPEVEEEQVSLFDDLGF